MSKINFAKFLASTKLGIKKHSPEIMVALGITGSIASTVSAIALTPKAIEAINNEKKRKHVDKLKFFDMVRVCWKYYIPSALSTASSITCVLCANRVQSKRNAALATACSVTESAFRAYKEKVIETLGEKKDKNIVDAVSSDKVKNAPSNETIIVGANEVLCMDSISGRHFKSTAEKLRKIENKMNHQMLTDINQFASLNDFYYEVGLPETPIGEELGWNIDTGLIQLYFSTQLTENDEPCIVVNFDLPPMVNYQR